jgi:methionyl-tRNA synthetase
VLGRLEVELVDLSVSRTTFDWGIKVPGGEGHVMYVSGSFPARPPHRTPPLTPHGAPPPPRYVWFDALSNYLTHIGVDACAADPLKACATAAFWPCNIHLIGKDIIWFHCVIWPALLFSAGLPLPKTVLAHGFVHGFDGRKMSKSLNNAVDPYDVRATLARRLLPRARRRGATADGRPARRVTTADFSGCVFF